MKKNRLDGGYAIDFELFGLVSNKKEYQLAWYLNQAANILLVKQEDIKIEYANNVNILISNFRYETDYLLFELLQNRLVGGGLKSQLLMPELKQFDYFLKFRDQTDELTSENVNAIIKQIPIVEYAMRLNFDNLKSKENLIY